jgi:AraC family cel operon transcriptional repressor
MVQLLQEKHIIDRTLGFHFATYSSIKPTTQLHYHDFFELFFIAEGTIQHHINGEQFHLEKGSLVFVRPPDQHRFSEAHGSSFKMFNLAFNEHTMKGILAFLDDVFPHDLIEAKMPSLFVLSDDENKRISRLLERTFIRLGDNQSKLIATIRLFLADVFIRYYSHLPVVDSSSEIPDWLITVYRLMEKREHLIEGLPRLYTLSNKTPEHICRMTQKYFKQTPTEKLNETKLDLAQKLLSHSNLDVLAISLECGFHNLSHFYHVFKKQNGCAPQQYRKMSQKDIIPQ